MKVSIDCDDVCPENCGKDTKLYSHFKELKELGFPVTIFVPANYHGVNALVENFSWIFDMERICDIQAHGNLHTGYIYECEFYTPNEIDLRAKLEAMKSIFKFCGIDFTVLRPPGWLFEPKLYNVLREYTKYLSIHDDPNFDMINIHQLREPKKDFVILHSHASKNSGDNNLDSPLLFVKLKKWLADHRFEYKTVGEMYEIQNKIQRKDQNS